MTVRIFILLLALWAAAGCQARPELLVIRDDPPPNLPTLMPTAPLFMATVPPRESPAPAATSTPFLPPTFTPVATSRFMRTATPIPETSGTPPPLLTPTAAVAAFRPFVPVSESGIDRTCPNPAPEKPEYFRYYLSARRWPTPDPARSATHFWLSKPLPGGGRFLINDTYPYGWDLNGRLMLHNAVDSAGGMGTPVLAAADGTVVVAQADMNAWYGWRCDWYGHLVVIEHDQLWHGQPIFTLYGHVLNINVEPGQRVVRGEQIAEVGVGGAASAPHLHFEVRIGSNEFRATRNPMLWISPGETRGVIAGRLLDPEGRPWQGVTLHLLNEQGEITATTWSYLGDPLPFVNPDEGLAENFLFSDIIPGDYRVYTELQGVVYQQPVSVTASQVVLVEIITEPLRLAEPDEEVNE